MSCFNNPFMRATSDSKARRSLDDRFRVVTATVDVGDYEIHSSVAIVVGYADLGPHARRGLFTG